MESIRQLDPDTFFAEIAVTEDAILLDVRPASETLLEPPLSGAFLLDYIDISFDEKFSHLDPLSQFYLYCSDGILSIRASNHLQTKGVHSLTVLKGGKRAWNQIQKQKPIPKYEK
ncbi:MAG: rhodanese-like domain-containing protein [Saprospiraceae bacterium]